MLKRLASSEAVLALGGFMLALHFRLVGLTNRVVRMPDTTFYAPFEAHESVIIALWHGEHFLMPFFGWRKDKLNILVTLHRDGEIVARAGRRFGLKFIRGSGAHGREFVRKKAVQAFTAMLRLLKHGQSVALTADVPKVARVAGLGIVTLAKYSGAPIIPIAMTTSRRYRMSNWDRTCVNLPFGRLTMVRGEPILVARDADDAGLEAARQELEASLNDVTARAYEIADERRREAERG